MAAIVLTTKRPDIQVCRSLLLKIYGILKNGVHMKKDKNNKILGGLKKNFFFFTKVDGKHEPPLCKLAK
jgi:hypothetical protein